MSENFKSVDELVNTLTLEEIKEHKELIGECREREAKFYELGKHLRDDIHRFTAVSKKMFKDLGEFHRISQDLHEACRERKDIQEQNPLNLIPDDKFFHA